MGPRPESASTFPVPRDLEEEPWLALPQLLEALPIPVFCKDAEGCYVFFNRAFPELLGMDPLDLVGRKVQQITPLGSADRHLAADREVLETGEARPYELAIQDAGGRQRWAIFSKKLMRDPQGKPRGVMGVIQDVTERLCAEEQVRRAAADFHRLFAAAPVGLALVDAASRIVEVNAGLSALTRRSVGELGGLRMGDALGCAQAHEHGGCGRGPGCPACPLCGAVQGALEQGLSVRGLEILTEGEPQAPEEPRWLHVNVEPMVHGEGPHAVVSVDDITERKRAQEAERRLNAELERRVQERTRALESANRELEAFTYAISHDLRAPLRGIDGFSLALEEDYAGSLDAKGLHYLRRIRAGAQRMGSLIDALLSLSRMTRHDISRQAVDLSALALRILEDLAQREPGRDLSWQVEPGLEARADPRLMHLLLENLLGNAWKFTSRTPKARIAFRGVEGPGGERAFALSDNGAGFDMTYAGKLFGAFQRLHSDAEFPGTGIGLATVRRIVHRHGGRIRAEGAPGRGATFTFTIPEEREACPGGVASPNT